MRSSRPSATGDLLVRHRRGASLIQRFVHIFLGLPGPLVLGGVLLLSAAEAALFFGFVIPGEIAVLLGGVLAARGNVSPTAVFAAAGLGATVGDFIGFLLGRHYGAALLERSFPAKWPPIKAWLRRRGPPAIFWGRSTAFLRAAIPTAAGAARMPLQQFLFWNVLGGVCWAAVITLIGYSAGEGYEAAIRLVGRGSSAILVLVVIVALSLGAKRLLLRRLAR